MLQPSCKSGRSDLLGQLVVRGLPASAADELAGLQRIGKRDIGVGLAHAAARLEDGRWFDGIESSGPARDPVEPNAPKMAIEHATEHAESLEVAAHSGWLPFTASYCDDSTCYVWRLAS